MSTFNNLIAFCSAEIKESLFALFRRMGQTRNEEECYRCYEELVSMCTNLSEKVLGFVNDVWEKRGECIKAFCDSWNLGISTSSIAESANSRLKRQAPSGSQSLVEIRKLALELEEQGRINKEWLKNRKCYKIKDPLVDEIMKNLGVPRPVAEALAGSYRKAEKAKSRLTEYGTELIVAKDLFQSDILFEVSIVDGFCECTCHKL
jgi:hypothetical protein